MPAPTSTELLAEDICGLRESNQRIAARVDILETAVRDLGRDRGNFRAPADSHAGGLRGGIASEIRRFRDEVIEKLDEINTNLEKFQPGRRRPFGSRAGPSLS
jgi:hypothetical protein